MEHEPEKRWSPVRLGLLAGVVVGIGVGARLSGLDQRLSVEGLRALVADAGALGPPVFVVAFCVGELAHVPGLVFVGAALLAWGPVVGGLLAFAAALASVSTTFLLVRSVGGRPAAALERPAWARRLLDRLEQRPIVTVALLRAVLVLSPPLNYALALTSLRFVDHLIGSAIGLVLPIGGAALVSRWIVAGP